jgi:hypothetical protein
VARRAELSPEEFERGVEYLLAQAEAQGKGRTVSDPAAIEKLSGIISVVVRQERTSTSRNKRRTA